MSKFVLFKLLKKALKASKEEKHDCDLCFMFEGVQTSQGCFGAAGFTAAEHVRRRRRRKKHSSAVMRGNETGQSGSLSDIHFPLSA